MGITLCKNDYTLWNEMFLLHGYGLYKNWEDMPDKERQRKLTYLRKNLNYEIKKYKLKV